MKIKSIIIVTLVQCVALACYAQQANQPMPAKSSKGNSGNISQTHELKKATSSDNKPTNNKQSQLKQSDKSVNSK